MKYKTLVLVLLAGASSGLNPQVGRGQSDSSITKRIQAVGMCGAGGGGSTAGSQMHENVYLTAPTGYFLDPDSLRFVKKEKPPGWQFGLARDPVFSWSRIPEGAALPNTMIGTPSSCDGQNGDTQGRVDFTFEVKAYPRSR